MHGPAGIADVVALVDTGAGTSIVPLSIADDLGIATTPGAGPGAIAFGGQSIRLSFAEVVLELGQDQQTVRWREDVLCRVSGRFGKSRCAGS